MASEGKQRKLVRELTDGITGELIPFSFPDRQRGQVVKQAPCVWVEDLEKKIIDTIEFNERYVYTHNIYIVHVDPGVNYMYVDPNTIKGICKL